MGSTTKEDIVKKLIALTGSIVLRLSGPLRVGGRPALDGTRQRLQRRRPGRPGQLRGRHQRERPLRPRELAGEEPGSRRHEQSLGRLRPRPQDRRDEAGQRLEWRRPGQAGLRSLGRLDRRRDQRWGPVRRLQVRFAEPRSCRHEPRYGRLPSRSQDPPDEASSASAAPAARPTAQASCRRSAQTAAMSPTSRWRRISSAAIRTGSRMSSSETSRRERRLASASTVAAPRPGAT